MATNPFYVEPGANYGATLTGLGNTLTDYRQQRDEKAKQEQMVKRFGEVKQAMTDAYASGDPDRIAQVAIDYPEAQKTVEVLYGFKNNQTKQNALDTYRSVLANKDNPQEALNAINSRIAFVEEQGGDPSSVTLRARDQLQNMIASGQDASPFFRSAELDYASLASPQEWKSYAGAREGTADIATFNALSQGLNPDEIERARRIKLGLSPRAQGSSDLTIAEQGLTDVVGESKGRIAGQVKGSESTAKGESERKQDFINRGVAAAEGVPVVKRALSLLDSVKTGGFDKAAIQAKQLLGVESADEGELSYNLGRSVLSQLRETFGAAFTAAEGERLQQLEASLGRSPAANRRILQQAETMMMAKAKRGRKAAEDSGDDFTVSDIDNFLSMSLDPSRQGGSGKGANTGGIVDVNDLVNKYAD